MAKTRSQARFKRRKRIRGRISGSADRPRLAVFRSLSHVYAQVIDDTTGRTLASASSRQLNLEDGTLNKTEQANQVGQLIAKACTQCGVSAVVFDRGGYPYHGRVRALADAARGEGLKF